MSEKERVDRLERMVLLITDRLPMYERVGIWIGCLGCNQTIEHNHFDMLRHDDGCPVQEIEAFRKLIDTE